MFRITRVGAEPLIVWGRDPESDLPRATVMLPGWSFEGPGGAYVKFGEGAVLSFTITKFDGVALVPSDPEPDIEHGFVTIGVWSGCCGWTLAELRAIALAKRRQRRTLRGWLRSLARALR